MRKVVERIEQSRKNLENNHTTNLKVHEINTIYEISGGSPFNLIVNAWLFGYSVGQSARNRK
jgi:hypothetical protein